MGRKRITWAHKNSSLQIGKKMEEKKSLVKARLFIKVKAELEASCCCPPCRSSAKSPLSFVTHEISCHQLRHPQNLMPLTSPPTKFHIIDFDAHKISSLVPPMSSLCFSYWNCMGPRVGERLM